MEYILQHTFDVQMVQRNKVQRRFGIIRWIWLFVDFVHKSSWIIMAFVVIAVIIVPRMAVIRRMNEYRISNEPLTIDIDGCLAHRIFFSIIFEWKLASIPVFVPNWMNRFPPLLCILYMMQSSFHGSFTTTLNDFTKSNSSKFIPLLFQIDNTTHEHMRIWINLSYVTDKWWSIWDDGRPHWQYCYKDDAMTTNEHSEHWTWNI